MIFFFTATGNSLYIAKQLDSELVSIAQAIHKNTAYQAEKIGIVCPVYGHEMPQIVKDFLKKSRFETDYLYLILTYGNRHGGAAELAQQFVESIGLHFDYINIILTKDNFLPAFDMNEQTQLDKNEDKQIAAVKTDIEKKRIYISPVTETDRNIHKQYLQKIAKMPKDTFSNIYRITNECIGCGICTKVCPQKCFTMENQKSIWNSDGCIMCMACIHACPMTAIQMSIPEKNPHARYRNTNISICEIIKANSQLNGKQEYK